MRRDFYRFPFCFISWEWKKKIGMKLTFDLDVGKSHKFPSSFVSLSSSVLASAWKEIKVKSKALICLKQMIREKGKHRVCFSNPHATGFFMLLCWYLSSHDPIWSLKSFFSSVSTFLCPGPPMRWWKTIKRNEISVSSEKSSIPKLNKKPLKFFL